MVERETDIISLLEKALKGQPQEKLEEIGFRVSSEVVKKALREF